tara:strand:+ start:433 stop:804 length:372 start_codon:yes stop_codon:yes gene_type:complete
MARNQHKKDLINLAEAYGSVNEVFGGQHTPMMGMVPAAEYAPEDNEEHDKTGELSDKELLDKVKGDKTAGKRLLDAATKRVDAGHSLTPDERDALARDAYGDAEKHIAHDKKESEDFEDVGMY